MTLSLSIAVVPPSLQSKELISIPTPPMFVRLWLGDCWKQCTAQPECTWGNFISHWFRERECDLGNDKIIYLSNSQINSTASRGYHSLIIIRSPLQTILPHHAQKQKTRHSHSLYPLTAIEYTSSLNPQSASIQYICIHLWHVARNSVSAQVGNNKTHCMSNDIGVEGHCWGVSTIKFSQGGN